MNYTTMRHKVKLHDYNPNHEPLTPNPTLTLIAQAQIRSSFIVWGTGAVP